MYQLKKKIYTTFLGFCFIICLNQLANAQFWRRTNPGGGGWMMAVGAGPSGTILVGSDLSGAYRSTDAGQNWDAIGARQGLTTTHVGAVGFDPNNDQVIFLGTNRGIYRSFNGGDSVIHVLEGTNASITTTAVEISKHDSNIGFATVHPGYNSLAGIIVKTLDNGITWTQISQDLPDNLRLLKLILHPTNPDILFVVSGGDRFACGPAELYRSQNGGVNWTQVGTTVPEGMHIMDASISPTDPNVVYLTTMNITCNSGLAYEGDLYKSIDGGDTWFNPNPMDQEHSGIIWLDPNDPASIKLIDVRKTAPWIPTSGTFSSIDGGLSWTKTGNELNWEAGYLAGFNSNQGTVIHRSYGHNRTFCQTLGTDLSNSNKMYWVTNRFVYGSEDGGTTFTNLFTKQLPTGGWQSTGIENVILFDLEISEVDPDVIYAGFGDNGLWRSLDGAASWESCNHPNFTDGWDGFGGNSYSIAVDPEIPGTVWVVLRGTNNCHLVKSTDFGNINSWIEKSDGLPTSNRITDISIDPQSDALNRTIYAVVSKHIYKSEDDGDHWTLSRSDGGIWFVEVDPNDSQIIYAGGSDGFFRSTDSGANWFESGLPEMSEPGNSVDFYRKLYRGVSSIHPSHCEPGVLFLTAYGPDKGLYKSNDFGETWIKVLTNDFMRSVMISKVRSEYVFAGSSFVGSSGGFVPPNSSGLYLSEDSGETWIPRDAELTYPSIVDLESNHVFPEKVFAISQGTGIQYAFDWLLPHVFYEDADGDGFGNPEVSAIFCGPMTELGYISDSTDCDDGNPLIFPGSEEVPNNGIDEDCDGNDLVTNKTQLAVNSIKLYPNPVNDFLIIEQSNPFDISVAVYSISGKKIKGYSNPKKLDVRNFEKGVYLIEIKEIKNGYRRLEKLVVN